MDEDEDEDEDEDRIHCGDSLQQINWFDIIGMGQEYLDCSKDRQKKGG